MATSTLYKAQNERELYTIDFADDLATSETISSASVRVLYRGDTGRVTEKTTEFSPTVPAVSGTEVTFFLEQAGADEQDEGTYSLEVLATTSTGRLTVAMTRDKSLPDLEVFAA